MSNILKKRDLIKIQKNEDPFLMMDEVEIISENHIKGKKNFMKVFGFLNTTGQMIQMFQLFFKLRL